jgi:hypothetical protein
VDNMCTTPAKLCAAWGKSCGDSNKKANTTAITWENIIHRLCGRNTWRGFSGKLSTIGIHRLM